MNIKEKLKKLYDRRSVDKSQPTSSEVHVPSAGQEDEFETTIRKWYGGDQSGGAVPTPKIVTQEEYDDAKKESLKNNFDSDSNIYPELNNLGARIAKAALAGEEANPTKSDSITPFLDMQKIVEGMDYEMDSEGVDPQTAFESVQDNLEKDQLHYKKLLSQAEGTDDKLAKGDEDGLHIDLGSGHGREFGALGLDVYPFDHGTLIHDLSMGIPFPDESAKKITIKNSDELEPESLLEEIHRVLKPNGTFTYQGKKDLSSAHSGFKLEVSDHEIEKDNTEADGCFSQTFSKVHPDPATANDAEPKIGVRAEQLMPTDQLLSMAAMGYFSDGPTSRRDNQLLGYPSQGALVQKGGPGSGGAVTKLINMEKSPHISVGTRKGVLDNMHYFEDSIPMDKITHVGQEKYVPEKLKKMLKNYDEIKDKPIDVLKVGDEYHVIDGHHRFLAHKKNGAGSVKARVRVKAENSYIKKTMSEGKLIPIMKANNEKQIVYGVVLAPNEVDFQDDFMTAEDIEEAAHKYMAESRVIGSEHSKAIKAHPVESFIAPQDFEVSDGKYGPQKVTKGSWVLGVKVTDPKEWEKVSGGEYSGFSVGGLGAREEI